MQIDLTKEDLISMIKGLKGYESYELANELEKKGWGKLNGFPNEKWEWNENAFEIRNIVALYNFYHRLKIIANANNHRQFRR